MHILIVEDDPVVADVLGMTLEEAGHFQSTAHNIETALAELKHNAIDAVLLDINLPDGDGTRLARLIRKNHMPVPILVVSGNASTDDKIAALGAGADGYLTKPFDRFELLANLDAILGRMHFDASARILRLVCIPLAKVEALSHGLLQLLPESEARGYDEVVDLHQYHGLDLIKGAKDEPAWLLQRSPELEVKEELEHCASPVERGIIQTIYWNHKLDEH